MVLNAGDEAVCGSVGLSAGPHAVRAVAFQASPEGSYNATYRSLAFPCCTLPPCPASSVVS